MEKKFSISSNSLCLSSICPLLFCMHWPVGIYSNISLIIWVYLKKSGSSIKILLLLTRKMGLLCCTGFCFSCLCTLLVLKICLKRLWRAWESFLVLLWWLFLSKFFTSSRKPHISTNTTNKTTNWKSHILWSLWIWTGLGLFLPFCSLLTYKY